MKLEEMTGVRQENAAFELCVRNIERIGSVASRVRVVEMLQRHVMDQASKEEDPRQTTLPVDTKIEYETSSNDLSV